MLPLPPGLRVRGQVHADQLEAEGIDKFVQPFDALLATIDERLAAAR